MPKKSITKKSSATEKKSEEAAKQKTPDRYVETVGRRKTAIARVRLTGGRGEFVVNGKKAEDYFRAPRFLVYAASPFAKLKLSDKYNASVKVSGGGPRAQAEAVRLGLSRALVIKNPDFKRRLRKLGFLTRDSRMVERKKYGLKKARRAPQWAKR
jgi:small subunit ribosomal protein S9